MRYFTFKKAHVTLKKSELLLIFAALFAVAYLAGFFSGRLRGGGELSREDISIKPVETVVVTAAAAVPASQTPLAQPSAPSASVRPSASVQTEKPFSKIDINKAGADELQTLPGIGEAYAGRIIQYREQNGSFKSIYDITNVKGIGEKTFEKIKDQICVG